MPSLCRFLARAAVVTLFALCVPVPAQMVAVGDGGPGPVKAQHLTAELTSSASAVAPGGAVQAGLVLTLEEKWHVYWTNAGDAGEPPAIKWTLPAGITAGPMQFPIPTRLPLGPLMDFGYEDAVAFPVLLKAAPTVKPGRLHLDALVTWVVCREVCVPGKAKMGLDLDVIPNAPAAPSAKGAVGEALDLLPKSLPASDQVVVTGGKQDFVFTLRTGEKHDDAEFYPFDQDVIANAPDQDVQELPDGVRVWVPRSPDLKTLPKEIHGLLRLSDDEAYEFTAPVTPGEMPRVAGAAKGGTGATAATTATVLGAVGLAFLGGIVLNLMPCVFPVLFLKGLALVQTSGEERSKMRMHGVVYALGIVVSFWLIVAVLLALRSTTNQIGWGFQLQSPTFLAVLALGLFFFSLSLAGQFELGLSLTSAGDSLTRKQGYAGSFTGVLATVVATPCTAPLMGAAIGFALAQPAWITFAVFTALALGLAAPYLALTVQPGWTKVLPRPGAWMETLKQLTAVPLFATVIWLTWVYGRLFSDAATPQKGVDRVADLMLGFLLLAIAGWVLAKWPANRKGTIAAVVLGALALAAPLYQRKDTTLVWAPYSQAALDTAQAAGKPVFIDFTAAWCLSCQVNERLVLKSAEVQEQFRSHDVVLLRADWTQYDEAITRELASVGRSGVPTYVLYPATKGAKPEVLPELLTKPIVLHALTETLR